MLEFSYRFQTRYNDSRYSKERYRRHDIYVNVPKKSLCPFSTYFLKFINLDMLEFSYRFQTQYNNIPNTVK